ncbi:unnamed protein product, partial [Effrenium voratum]
SRLTQRALQRIGEIVQVRQGSAQRLRQWGEGLGRLQHLRGQPKQHSGQRQPEPGHGGHGGDPLCAGSRGGGGYPGQKWHPPVGSGLRMVELR